MSIDWLRRLMFTSYTHVMHYCILLSTGSRSLQVNNTWLALQLFHREDSDRYLSFDDISLMIFDECHATHGNHPYRVLMNLLLDYKNRKPEDIATQVRWNLRHSLKLGADIEKLVDCIRWHVYQILSSHFQSLFPIAKVIWNSETVYLQLCIFYLHLVVGWHYGIPRNVSKSSWQE